MGTALDARVIDVEADMEVVWGEEGLGAHGPCRLEQLGDRCLEGGVRTQEGEGGLIVRIRRRVRYGVVA